MAISGQTIEGKVPQKRGPKTLEQKVLADTNYLVARGYSPVTCAMVLEHIVDERKTWKRLIESEDDRIVLATLQFLVSMRDGKPAQRISVTSTQLSLNGSDLDKARAIVAEIRGELSPQPSLGNVLEAKDIADVTSDVTQNGADQHNAEESRGGEKGSIG